MRILLVDTAGPTGGVLLAEVDLDPLGVDPSSEKMEILGVVELHPRAYSAELIPAISELLYTNRWQLADVDALAVVSGPGSFTGLRVGLSAVKAMAEATGRPILTVSRLAILASMAAQIDAAESPESIFHVVLDAGRGEFYHGVYRDAGKTCLAESFATLDALLESIRNQPAAVVVAEPAVKIALGPAAGAALREIPAPAVRDALPLAVAAWQAGQLQDAASVDANYLRRSDAVVVSRTKTDRTTPPPQSQGL